MKKTQNNAAQQDRTLRLCEVESVEKPTPSLKITTQLLVVAGSLDEAVEEVKAAMPAASATDCRVFEVREAARKTMVRVSLALIVISTLSSVASGQSVSEQIAARTGNKRVSASPMSHIDGALRQTIEQLHTQPAALQPQGDAGDRRVPVTIRFRSAAGATNRSIVASVDAVPANEYRDVIESYVPVNRLEALARNPEVLVMESILPPRPKLIGQGASVHNASSWQATGHSGAGVKVGIIDVGFIGLSSLSGSELPVGIIGRCYTAFGGFSFTLADCETQTAHGTAVAEAVADIAPGIQLYVANPTSPLDLRNTVAWMTAQGVRVINHSVGWVWSGPGDGTTPFADSPLSSVDYAVGSGAVWTNAAGNDALSTWSGAFTDTDGDGLLDFSGQSFANGVNLKGGSQFIAQARWEDSWTAAARDLDLYLVDALGNIVAASEASQSGAPGGTPRELLRFTPPSDGDYYLVISRYSGTIPDWVDVQAFSGEVLQFRTAAHSIANPAETANPGALAVGAVAWSDTGTIERFSSNGPTRDGRMKPDLVAADRADSVTYGVNGFAGTSQSSPHVAGLAALVLEAFPAAAPRLVAEYLRKVASPRGSPGNTFGVGFAQVPLFPASLSLSAVLTDSTFPSPAGQPISWTAFAIGGQAPFEYKFWLFNPSSGWSVLREYGLSNEVTWTPWTGGTYSLQVWVRRVGSAASYEDWKSSGDFTVAPPAPLTVSPPVADVAMPAPIGTWITWTAAAHGGIQPLEYRFWRFRAGVGWSVVRDYSVSNTFSWMPTASEAGTYTLQVWVRHVGSQEAYDAWAGTEPFDIVIPPVAVRSLTASVIFPVTVGTPITWSAVAGGGGVALQYKFWRFRQGAGWTMVQDYSSANTFTWTPGASDAGTYAMQVWVRQTGSSVSFEAWRGTDFVAINPPPAAKLTSFTQTPALATTPGLPITWAATATGGIGPVQYKFWLQSSGTWSVLQDYSSLSSVTWTPLATGVYAVQVWVRSSGSAASYEDWRGTGSFTVSGSSAAFVSDLSPVVSLPATVTHPITWKATAGGGTAPLQYQFWRYKQSVGWSMVQDYSGSDTYTWTPGLGDDATYALQVWVRSSGSTESYEAWRGTAFFQILPPTVLFMTSMTGDYIGGGTVQLYTSADGAFIASRNFHNGVSISEVHPGYVHWWYLDFAAPADAVLTPGLYSFAERFPFQQWTNAGLSVNGDGRGCNESAGRFVVLDVEYAPDGTPTRFAADFEQHCEGWAAALYGSIRINSTVPVVDIRPLAYLGTSLTSVGIPLTWSAPATSGRQYRAWRYRGSTRTWIELHDYAAEPTISWTPQPGDQGDWTVIVWERAKGSAAMYDTWRVGPAIRVQ